MAFPQVQSLKETSFVSDTTAHAVSMPTTVNSGDLLIALFANHADTTVTTPSGWTLEGSGVAPSNTQRLSIYTKTADGTEGGTTVDFVTASAEAAVAQVYRITAWLAVEIGTFATGTGANPDPPSLNPAGWGVEDTLWLAVESHSVGRAVSSYPTSYTNGNDTIGLLNNANTAAVSSARRENATGTENPGTFTLAFSDPNWVANTIAIQPTSVQTLSPPALSVTPTLYTPTVTLSTQNLSPPVLSVTPTLYTPSVATGITAPFFDNPVTLYTPSVTWDQTLAAPVLDVTPTLYTPELDIPFAPVTNNTDTDFTVVTPGSSTEFTQTTPTTDTDLTPVTGKSKA